MTLEVATEKTAFLKSKHGNYKTIMATNSGNDNKSEKSVGCFSKLKPLFGLGIVAISALLFGFAQVFVKKLSHVDFFSISCIRFFIIGMMSFPILMTRVEIENHPICNVKFKESPFPSGKRWLLFWRSFLGATNNILSFYAVQHLPLADCMMISATSPMFTTIQARIFLKEKISSSDIINILLVFAGIIFIVKPPFIFGQSEMYTEDPEAVYAIIAICLGSMFLQSSVYTILRMIKGIHWSVINTIFGSIGFIECLVAVLIFSPLCLPESPIDLIFLILIGVLSFIAQIGLVISCKLEKATTVSIVRKAFDVIFAFIFQILLFQQIPGSFSILGALIIFLAVFSSGFKKIWDSLNEDHWMKHNLILKYLYE